MKTHLLAGVAMLAALGFAAAQAQAIPILPPHMPGTRHDVRMLKPRAHSGMVPGMQARAAPDMEAGSPLTPMPPGSIAGQAPGMGSPRVMPR